MTKEDVLNSLHISIQSEFIPYSRSKNAKPSPKLNDLSLNWKVKFKYGSLDVLTTNYSAGCGHCPSYLFYQKNKCTDYAQQIRTECETGKTYRVNSSFDKKINPNIGDVIYCLLLDSEAINYPTFENWAKEFDYNTDSRQAEEIYRQCLTIGLSLRVALGEENLKLLNEAFQDY